MLSSPRVRASSVNAGHWVGVWVHPRVHQIESACVCGRQSTVLGVQTSPAHTQTITTLCGFANVSALPVRGPCWCLDILALRQWMQSRRGSTWKSWHMHAKARASRYRVDNNNAATRKARHSSQKTLARRPHNRISTYLEHFARLGSAKSEAYSKCM